MNVEIEDVGTCRKKVNVEWPAERVDADYKKVLAEYCKVAKIKGFRPGKAPVKVVEKRYAKQMLEDLRDRLVPAGYQQSIKDNNLKVVTVLEVDEPEVAVGQPLKFAVTVEVEPDFPLPEYKGIALTRKVEPVPEERVDETIQSIQDQFASFDEVTGRAVQKGDLVQVDYEGICEGAPIESLGEEVKGLGERKDFWVRADENAFIPEFADGLVGAEVGQKREIQVDFKDDFPVKALAGKKASYFVDVKGIREKKVPPMDEEFFKRLGVEDEATLRERIREDLVQAAERRETGRLRNEAIEHLLSGIQVDLPPTAVSRETQQIIQDIIRENTSRGAAQEQLMEKKDEIMESATRNAEGRVKAQFVLDRIADAEQIEVNPQQLREHIERLARSYGMTADALRAELKKREALDNVKAELRRSLAVDFIMDQAKIAEEKGV